MKKNEVMLDLYRYTKKNTITNLLKQIIFNPGFRFIYIFRRFNYHREHNNKLRMIFFKILWKRYRTLYGYEISLNAKIGYGFYINHLGPIVVNPKCIIGKNINIHNGVTLGQENRGKRKGAPFIGDYVWIGANSVIVGNIKIGNNVLIAPNSYVNFDVPENSIVIGNPAKIIKKENATIDYIQNIVK
ncbi:serine O-acetyltransferase [Clostridium perfringens]